MKKLTIRAAILSLLSVLLLFVIAPEIRSETPLYVDTPNKDFNADAPWRVQSAGTPIPFSFLIKDVWKNDLEQLHFLQIDMVAYPGGLKTRIYKRWFYNLQINEHTTGSINGNWEWQTKHFSLAENGLAGEITARKLGYGSGDDIYFVASIDGEDDLGTKTFFEKYLKVHVGVPLPKPGPDWYYGDTHYHTEYTNDPKEYGGQLTAVKEAAAAMGLDFVTTTDHASNLADGGWQGWFGAWDLSPAAFNDLKARSDNLNDPGTGLPFIVGEEITVQAIAGDPTYPIHGIHLLVYNNSNFISGHVNLVNEPAYSLASRLARMDADTFAYAAHPLDELDPFIIGGIASWSDDNFASAYAEPKFAGLEIWNTRKTMKSSQDGTKMDKYVNPFDANGQWAEDISDWDAHLTAGIEMWDQHLRAHLNPLRKIFIEGGSDAHGDLNYVVSGFSAYVELNDNAIGKVRTLVYAPGGTHRDRILAGLKNGRSVVTDGPVVSFSLNQEAAIMGDAVALSTAEAAAFKIHWQSSSEFGDIDEIVIVRGDQNQSFQIRTIIPYNGQTGSYTWVQQPADIQADKTYYYRVEARIKDGGQVVYRAYTNPIWVTWASERGAPRVQYAREYWVVDNRATLSELQQIVQMAYPQRITVGFSYDDAGIGDLDVRKVTVWGFEHERAVLLNWYKQYYGGVTVKFRTLPGRPYRQYGPYTTQEPAAGRGKPRIQYAREYWVMHSGASQSQVLAIAAQAHQRRNTIGFSYDDAGIGDLDWRHVVVWGNEHDPAVLIYWYNRYYAGATLEFRPLP